MSDKAENTTAAQASSEFVISECEPLKEYEQLMDTNVTSEELDDKTSKENFKKIGLAVHDVIFKLVFDCKQEARTESQHKAGELLAEYKSDACFYAPWPYNEWIVKLRDELLKQEQLDFWRDVVVKKQLGPCWARDSDAFDSEDKPPLEFYAHAGCVAPFAASLKVKASNTDQTEETPETDADRVAAMTGNFEAVITADNPLKQYRDLMKRFVVVNIHVDDDIHKASVQKIATAVRSIICQLLFEGTPTQQEYDTASELLQEYKSDAAFYGPWDYNDWIVELRDRLLERNMLEFWSEKIVKLELGPCCSRDSDFFDRDDSIPVEFYNRGGCTAPFDPPVVEQD
ncbi:EndoGI [Drosophila busckii]|uniref:EndoGI n=1 Tax=Drosophila busckii TaxID=30019 RepID=A0A0M5IWP4_DROBS|nr:uncharacterized protein LOC108601764 [Drosophila busckii]ALC39644.1 EndoGI [Drosophila busckii]